MPLTRRVKMVIHLTAVTQYLQLQDRFHRNPNWSWFCLSASLAIVHYIHHHNNYLLCHHLLPLTKRCLTHCWIMSQFCPVFGDTWQLKISACLSHDSSVVISTRSSFQLWIYLRKKALSVNAQQLIG